MYRLLALAAFFALTNQSPAFGEGQKGNFALSFQGGGLGSLEGSFFRSLTPLFGGGLEYYLIHPVSVGAQFQFSTNGSFGSPVSLGVSSVSGSGFRTSTRLLQSTFFARPTLALGSGVKLFALAGVSATKVTRTSSGGVVPAGSNGSEDEGNIVGGKFGAGAFIHLKSNMDLNFTAAFDTRPQKLFSTQAGLTFFFNPFPKKIESTKNF